MPDYIIENGELKHYGVLGMKWGKRKAAKAGKTYTYKSFGQKRYEKKVAKFQEKGKDNPKAKKAQIKLSILKERDAARQEYAETTTVGKSIVKGLIMGPFGSGNYNRLRAAGESRISSALMSNILTGTLFAPFNAAQSRRLEFDAAKVPARANRRR